MVVARVFRSRRLLLPALGVAAAAVATTAVCVGAAHAFSTDGHQTVGAPPLTRAVVPAADRSSSRQVTPLRRLTQPDVIVQLPRSASPAAVRRLWRVDGIRSVAAVDTGTITVRGHELHAIGVDAGRIRSFTPALTAQSDALWQSVAGGDLTVGYAAAHPLQKRLGATVPVHGRHGRTAALRVGAFASIGLGSAQALMSHATAALLGLHPSQRLFISAPHLDIGTVAVDVRRLVDRHAVVWSAHPAVTQNPISAFAQSTIPAPYLALYRAAAATCPGLPWTVLAGIGAVETGHGANVHRSIKGAEGPMQFLPSTFAAYGVDGDGDGYADIMNPADAIYSAARYLCLSGASRGGQSLYDAIWAYNHADWYVRLVVEYANAYA